MLRVFHSTQLIFIVSFRNNPNIRLIHRIKENCFSACVYGNNKKEFYQLCPVPLRKHHGTGSALSSLLQQKPKSPRLVPEELPQDWPKYFDFSGYRSTQKGERDKNHSKFQDIELELFYVAFKKKKKMTSLKGCVSQIEPRCDQIH